MGLRMGGLERRCCNGKAGGMQLFALLGVSVDVTGDFVSREYFALLLHCVLQVAG